MTDNERLNRLEELVTGLQMCERSSWCDYHDCSTCIYRQMLLIFKERNEENANKTN